MQLDTVLYAEDEPSDIFFLEHAFQTLGLRHPIQGVRDGQEAIDYLAGNDPFADRDQYPSPCLALLDINMPLRSGLEVLEWIRQQPNLRSMPVLMLTSSSHPADIEKARNLRADDYILKPSNPMHLVQLVKSIHDRWLLAPTTNPKPLSNLLDHLPIESKTDGSTNPRH